MNNNKVRTIRPGGRLQSNFNKILAIAGLGWFTSMVILRYVVKPWRVNAKMKENEELMNTLYDNQMKQKRLNESNEL